MDRKNKFMIGLLMSVLFLMPVLFAASSQPALMERNSMEPIKNFGLSANPTVDGAAIVTNVDDTDNLYCGGYKDYIMTVGLEDDDAVGDIANVTIIFTAAAGEFASFQWVNTTNTWAELTGTDYLRLTTGTNTTHANEMNITITFKLEWATPDTDDVDIIVQVYATDGTEVNDTANVNYEFDSDLTLASDVFFTYAQAQQGDLMTVNTLTYSYEDSGGDNYPLAAETDFYVSRAARAGWPIAYYEAASYSDSTGVATWTSMAASGQEHTDTFTLYAVTQDGAGAGTTLMDSTHTDTINIMEGNPGTQTPRPVVDVTTDFLATPEGMGVLVVAIVVLGFGGYYYFGRNAVAPRRKTKRRKRR